MSDTNRRVLISTISSTRGGIARNREYIIRTLRNREYEPVLAFYEPYSLSPHLSVPSFKLMQRKVGSEHRSMHSGCEAHAIGAWLPELEFTNYLATSAWKRVIESCCARLTVAGNALACLPYFQTDRPFLSWISSGWHMDRKDRVKTFSTGRRLIDQAIVRPVVQRLEKSLLNSGTVLAASYYTKGLLDELAGSPVVKDVLPFPINTDFFSPEPEKRVKGRIGFSGRLSDPRKNVPLLLSAIQRLRKRGHDVSLLLIGINPGEELYKSVQETGIGNAVEFCLDVSSEELRDKLQTLDVFVVPSYQEGLCISALEAMACGCPVVSTSCGGPEEFVINGETGVLVGFDPEEMADAVLRLIGSPKIRKKLSEASREKVLHAYSWERADTKFWSAFNEQF